MGLLVQQLVLHGQLANLGPQTLDKVLSRVILIRVGLEARSPGGQEILSPPTHRGGGYAELPAEGLEVFTAKQADNSLGLALGGEPPRRAKGAGGASFDSL